MVGRFPLGGRVIKTSLAVGFSIFVAQSLGFERVTLAAIVALVTVQRTFYRSLQQSAQRLGSVLLGALLGTLVGLVFGATPFSYSLVTMAVILVCLRLNWQDNIVIVAVVAIGVLASQAENLPMYSLQQFMSALIGAAVALTVNFLFVPNHSDHVQEKLLGLESSLEQMTERVAEEMLQTEIRFATMEEDAELLLGEIRQGLELSKLFREEQRFSFAGETQADRYRDTFRYFSSQTERLLEMHYLAQRMLTDVPQAVPISRLLRILSQIQRRRLRGKNDHRVLLERLITNLDATFKDTEMPRTRAEFVTRSSLVHLYKEVKRYYRRILQIHPVLADDVHTVTNQEITEKKKEKKVIWRK